MDLTNFYEGMKQLSSFFGKNLTPDQSDFYYNDLKYVSKDQFSFACKTIQKERKPNPGNFPTIREIQALCPKELSGPQYHTDETECEYYKRITVSHLWQAYNILKNNGKEQFLRFCRANNFSDDDIERVEWKLKYSITPEKLEKKIKTVFNPERIEILKEQAQKITETGVPF